MAVRGLSCVGSSSMTFAAEQDVSFYRGGPFDNLERRLRLLRDDNHDVMRHAILFLMIGWAPTVILAIGAPEPLLLHLDLHVRWWIAVPVLFYGGQRIDARLQSAGRSTSRRAGVLYDRQNGETLRCGPQISRSLGSGGKYQWRPYKDTR